MRELIISEFEKSDITIPKRFIAIFQKFLSDSTPQKHLVLKEILEAADEYDFEDYDDENDPDIVAIVSCYYTLLREVVTSIAKQNLSSEVFYEKLYRNVFLSDLFPLKESDKGLVLFLLALRIPNLPYYEASNPIILSTTEFRDITEKIWDDILRARYMMNERFDTKTETTSQLCDIADSLESREQRAVFWAYVISSANRSKSQRE